MSANQTLFESLAIANAERIHSQVVAWVFNLSDDVLGQKVKLNALKELFNLSNTKDEDIGVFETCETEVKSIDILIETQKYLFVIENKLKSSEHTKQTTRYKEYVENEYANKTQRIYGFLSLIEDNPEDKDWVTITYEKLHNILKDCLLEIKKEKREYHLLSDYVETLDNLVKAYKSFRTEKEVLKYVFNKKEKKGIGKSEDREYENSSIAIIKRNRLETIFQKAFFKELCNALSLNHFEVDETHGNGQFATHLKRFVFNGTELKIAFSIQQNTMKISITPLIYNKSRKEHIEKYEKAFNSFKIIFNANGFKKFNNPRRHARYSYSKVMNSKIFEYDYNELINYINEEITKAKDLASKYLNENKFEEILIEN